MVCMTLDRVDITQSSIIRIIHLDVGLKCFYYIPKCLLLLLVFSYIYILQGSVEMHLHCGGIYNNHIIANLKKFENWSIIGKDMDKSEVPHFHGP